jgi:hypothetical protein
MEGGRSGSVGGRCAWTINTGFSGRGCLDPIKKPPGEDGKRALL